MPRPLAPCEPRGMRRPQKSESIGCAHDPGDARNLSGRADGPYSPPLSRARELPARDIRYR